MAKSQQTFNKKEKEKKRLKKRKDKEEKKEERKSNSDGGGLDSMIVYVDENGNFTDTPPDPTKKKNISANSIQIAVPKQEHVEVDPIKKGRVEFFDTTKGFGFIKENDSQEKYFVHVNGLNEEIKEGDAVSFELEKGMKGMNAVRVNRV